jgi:hypothetical protein
MSVSGHSLTSSSAVTRSAVPSGPDLADARRTGVGGMTSPPLLHTNCCKQVQEDEEIQNDIDFSSIKPKSRRQGALSRSKHFQSPRRPFSRPKGTTFTVQVPSAGRTSVRKKEERENGYGRYCNHDLRRDLPRTSRDVAVLLSARYLTGPHVARDFTGAGKKCRASRARRPRKRLLKNTHSTRQGYPDVSAVAGGSITPAGDIRGLGPPSGNASA